MTPIFLLDLDKPNWLLSKVKEPSLPCYFPIAWVEQMNSGFSKSITAK